MPASDDKITSFEESILLPALDEVGRSPRLLAEYAAEVVVRRPHTDPSVEELLGALAGALKRRAGPSLVLSSRERPAELIPIGGHYVMTVFYDEDDDEVFASPAAMFWMRFNNKLHAFNHRYDNDVEYHRVEDVTRKDVFDHILRSFDFYKLYAFSDKPFPGYR